ncbi:TPA: hypothetical protein DEW47_00235 [Patescibacteria group bacterium]|nr:MAG: hypothetical protein UT71_C0012G0010 [Parcubacteria group bacterium GW2011_GWF2_40_10]KKR46898.1 MAG: hypothetical protein UT83_C0016G0010 [Parcubacteria group bacterium GW2011_GWA2_40_143]KKR59662.1 MAG: hypothetical protein UT97_C0014G0012 [Parcubacteria group bacterium GW2011_GWC2_40_31]KKR75171.1 MAG: hypothetical protein UU18_C0012G0012 [Parcubacteria group bacterium GW2011_GWB2_40_8]KKR77750.1 MAG: hypothetical protein UU20_C0001G0023 [Parcubacteria group bacterium GW2011_GWE2_40_
MKKDEKTYANIVRSAVANLPFFSIEDLSSVGADKKYTKILLYRLGKAGEILRLKKGMYVSRKYLDRVEKENKINSYMEFVAVNLYDPAYLSLEYVLAEYGILTENTQAFTLVSKNKTNKFANSLGLFNYKHMKGSLFFGFKITKKDNFLISKTTVAKALFDFLYLRKKTILDKSAFLALRLNTENLKKEDLVELRKYAEMEGSKKMKEITNYLWEKKK